MSLDFDVELKFVMQVGITTDVVFLRWPGASLLFTVAPNTVPPLPIPSHHSAGPTRFYPLIRHWCGPVLAVLLFRPVLALCLDRLRSLPNRAGTVEPYVPHYALFAF